MYATSYYVKQTGIVATGPVAGKMFINEQTENIDDITEEQAKVWASNRHASYFPTGRVELWAKQWVQTSKRKGAFNHRYICTYGA